MWAAERNLRRPRAREPTRAAALPSKSSGKLADSIQVTLQISKTELARFLVNRFFLRHARGSERQYRRLHRLAIAQLISFPDFEETQVTLAVIQIPLKRRKHAHDAARTHHRRIFRQRVPDHGGRDTLGPEKLVAPCVH